MVSATYDSYNTIGRRSTVFSTKGVVCSSQALASEAGIRILRNGGNAADAAVAMAAALNVVEPCNTGIGGDVFALFYSATTRTVHAVNGSGRSPKALTLPKVREMGIEGNKFKYDNVHAATVPGACAAWVDIVGKWGSGKVGFKEILEPAITLAEEGFVVHQQAAYEWSTYADTLRQQASGKDYPFLVDGETPKAGEYFRNPALAKTFRTVAKEGKDGFYKGEIAKAIVNELQGRGSLMTLEDLASHESDFVQPISYTYGPEKLTVHECPPNGQGLAALIALGILDVLQEDGVVNLAEYEEGSAEWMHALIEAMRLAFADAHAYIADPKFSDVPVDALLSKKYLRERAKLFDPKKAVAQYHQGQPIPSSDTVYFTAADQEGNAISMINSNYLGFGTAIVPEGWGFSIQNRGMGFDLREGSPNVLEGGKRPYHTIIPAMVTQGDELFMAFGVMGGAMQPQGHLQTFLNVVHRSHHAQAALDTKRFCIGGLSYTSTTPIYNDTIAFEDGIPEEVIQKLKDMGHKIDVVKGLEQVVFGKGQMIVQTKDKRSGKRVWAAGSDPRGDGCALPQI
ncbi:gamma-glutamyltransferase [Kwoniella shandongensis]|uniref:Gamma-glutamyltransferase n=1 Tax=Kwoniella shandongensis TaxID=1734106 RepID=A0A5M6C249_9TREE|nr:gamma-glutamyltransferase [Kwoniella shandongensis]KAA5529094.1 gamma-glutamyltransferase [Kwoniella shandongensis]